MQGWPLTVVVLGFIVAAIVCASPVMGAKDLALVFAGAASGIVLPRMAPAVAGKTNLWPVVFALGGAAAAHWAF